MNTNRYTGVAISLHWLIALGVIAQIPMGLIMSDLPLGQSKFALFQLHKSVGLTILALSIVRVLWRLGHKPPPLPAAMPVWQKRISGLTHLAFYAFILITPLLGWAIVSASPIRIPTLLWGAIPIPHLPILADLPMDQRKGVAGAFGEAHELASWLGLALIALHLGAVVKHQFLDRDGILGRMVPFLAKPVQD